MSLTGPAGCCCLISVEGKRTAPKKKGRPHFECAIMVRWEWGHHLPIMVFGLCCVFWSLSRSTLQADVFIRFYDVVFWWTMFRGGIYGPVGLLCDFIGLLVGSLCGALWTNIAKFIHYLY